MDSNAKDQPTVSNGQTTPATGNKDVTSTVDTTPANAAHASRDDQSPSPPPDLEKSDVKPSSSGAGPPPNGGLIAWLQVVSSFFFWFNSFGFINAFGVWQTYYEQDLLSSHSPSQISWIGTIQAFFLLGGSLFTGPLFDRGYGTVLATIGSFLIVFGYMMLSLCTKYWEVILAQSICMGIGFNLVFVVGTAIPSMWFTSKMPVANGVAASGSGLAGILYPIIFDRVQREIGFAWSMRIIGFIVLATQIVALALVRFRSLPPVPRKIVAWAELKDLAFSWYCANGFLTCIAEFVPIFYTQLYAIDTIHGLPRQLGFYLLPIMHVGSTLGRLISGFIAQRTGTINLYTATNLALVLIMLCYMAVHSTAGIIVIALFYGVVVGAIVALVPAVTVVLTKNRAMISTRMGMAFASGSLGVLIGNPIAGAIVLDDGYKWVWLFAGLVMFGGTVTVAISRVLAGREGRSKKL